MVNADGKQPLSYQWLKNGDPIAGATQSRYQTPPTNSGDNGSTYAVIVTNALGSITSNNAVLTVR
jgi:hypothetical protein